MKADQRHLRPYQLTALIVSATSAGLVPWTLHLWHTLPAARLVPSWTAAWVGFDVALSVVTGVTAWAAYARRPRTFVVAAAAGATLMLADAWFDVAMDAGTGQWTESVSMALLMEVPGACLLGWRAAHVATNNLIAVVERPGR